MRKRGEKGFTMIELLAVVAILGIISTIAIAGIGSILKRTKDSYLDTQNKMVVLAGKSYYGDNRSKLPKIVGPVHEVTLKRLIELNYIDPVKDAEGKDCVISAEGKESKVYVQKVGKEDYKYRAYLYCSGEESGINDSTAPTVTLSPMKTEETSNFPITVILKATDDNGVLSYRYVIYKNGKEYKDTGYKNYSKEVAIKLKETGIYTIKGFAYDIAGNKGSVTSEEYHIEILPPNCGSFVVNTDSGEDWQNKNAVMTIETKDVTIESWSIKDKHYDKAKKTTTTKSLVKKTVDKKKEITLKDNGEHKIIVEGYNSAGEKCSRELSTYKIDKEKPAAPTLTNPTKGGWTNKDFSLSGLTSEKYAGVSHWQYSYDQKSWTTYESSETEKFTTTPFSKERNQNVYIRVIDKAGNISEVSSTPIKIDKTAPTAPTLVNPYASRWMNASDKTAYKITATTTESLSGVAYWQYSYDQSAWTTYGSSASNKYITTEFTKDRNGNVYIRAVDKAGNISPVASSLIRIDKTPPTKPTLSNSYGNKWKNESDSNAYTITASTTESLTGVAYWQYSYNNSSWSNYGGSASTRYTTPAFTGDQNRAFYMRAVDGAGNVSASSNSMIKIDQTPPSCVTKVCINGRNCTVRSSVSIQMPDYVSLRGECSDSLSRCMDTYVLRTYNKELSNSYESPGFVDDNAGNYSYCSWVTVTIDPEDDGEDDLDWGDLEDIIGGGDGGGGGSGGGGGGGSTSSSGYMGQWVCSDCKSYCSSSQVQSGGTCLKPANGIAGNVLVKVNASSSGSGCANFSWTIMQGPETWIGSGYGVTLRVGGASATLKDSGSTWSAGSTNSGNTKLCPGAGNHSVSIIGNSSDPSFSTSIGSVSIS